MALIYTKPLSKGRDIRATKTDGSMAVDIAKTLTGKSVLKLTPPLHRFLAAFITRLNHGPVGQCIRASNESDSGELMFIIWDPTKAAILTYQKDEDSDETAHIFSLNDLEQIYQSLTSIVLAINLQTSLFPSFILRSVSQISLALSTSAYVSSVSHVVTDPNSRIIDNVSKFIEQHYCLNLPLPPENAVTEVPKTISDLVEGATMAYVMLFTRSMS